MISCCCPTHGRAHLLPEVLESFRRQDHSLDLELVIVNDCPEQPLACSMPKVRVINLPEPIPDLSTKFHRAVECCNGDWVAWWEDDDVSLPFRLRWSWDCVYHYGMDYYKQIKAWQRTYGAIEPQLMQNLFFGTSLFSRKLWDSSGGSAPGQWADMTAHDNLRRCAGKFFFAERPEPQTAFFVYCWTGRCQHDSGLGSDSTAADRFKAFREGVLSDHRFKPGLQTIAPRWDFDYVRHVRKAMEQNARRMI